VAVAVVVAAQVAVLELLTFAFLSLFEAHKAASSQLASLEIAAETDR
jgi:hypothetical protein